MRISLFGGAGLVHVDQVVERARTAADAGLDGAWFPQTPSLDALTALAVAAREVPAIALGTAVVPIQGRHPYPLAQAALTVADGAGPGRITLGVGVTHAVVSEGVYGIPYTEVVPLAREHLSALGPLLSEARAAEVEGERIVARGSIALDGGPPGLLLAALGPRMVDLAGRATDGTITWMTGPRALAGLVPALRAAAHEAGRPAPRVVVGLPVCVTDDAAGAREVIGAAMGAAAQLPSYRRTIAAEGVAAPVDLALVGSADALRRRLEELEAVGATELVANLIGPPETQGRTVEALAACVGLL